MVQVDESLLLKDKSSHIMDVDVLATQRNRASTTMILIILNRNNTVSAR